MKLLEITRSMLCVPIISFPFHLHERFVGSLSVTGCASESACWSIETKFLWISGSMSGFWGNRLLMSSETADWSWVKVPFGNFKKTFSKLRRSKRGRVYCRDFCNPLVNFGLSANKPICPTRSYLLHQQSCSQFFWKLLPAFPSLWDPTISFATVCI